MAGTLSVQKIQGLATSATPTTVEIASGHKISGAAGAISVPGQVVQVQTAASPAFTSSTSTTLVDVFTLNFTPKFSNSLLKIDICCRYQENGTDSNLKYRVLNDSTTEYDVTNYSAYQGGATNTIETLTFHVFASAGSTSARDIKFQMAKVSSGGTFYINPNGQTTEESRLTVMEIAQ